MSQPKGKPPSKKKLYSFDDHPEHLVQLEAWRDKWIANALSTAPADREVSTEAVIGLYVAADLKPPRNIVFAPSPVSAAIAGTIAAGVWHLRQHPEVHQVLFGRQVTEAELMAAVSVACETVVTRGMARVQGERESESSSDTEAD